MELNVTTLCVQAYLFSSLIKQLGLAEVSVWEGIYAVVFLSSLLLSWCLGISEISDTSVVPDGQR